ncbi:hypothetical protein G6F23_015601 [Rhizopus arrhizus]|nr:hypothetical protein G6F23_015601 [Rhizopus arrhizus]
MRLAQLAHGARQAVGGAARVRYPVRQPLGQQIDARGAPALRPGPGRSPAEGRSGTEDARLGRPGQPAEPVPRPARQLARAAPLTP